MAVPDAPVATPVTRVELKRLALADLCAGDELLRGSPLLRALPPEALAPLLAAAVVRRVAPDGRVFRQGEAGRSLYFVLAGEARLLTEQDGLTVELGVVRKGELFGEGGLATGARTRGVTATASAAALDVAELPAEAVEAASSRAPAVGSLLRALHAERHSAQAEMSAFLGRW